MHTILQGCHYVDCGFQEKSAQSSSLRHVVMLRSLVIVLVVVQGIDNEIKIRKRERELRHIVKLGPSEPLSEVKPWHYSRPNHTKQIPAMLYGTAYKRHSTADAVERALRAGFFGIDTATAEGSRYNDSGVGEALRRVVPAENRDQLFIQLKIHHVTHRDEEQGDATARVLKSFRRGLANLGVDYVDSLMLRGPSRQALRTGLLSQYDIDAWTTMHELKEAGYVRFLGLANFSPRLIDQIFSMHGITRPLFLQAKCHADSGWARMLRDYCKANNMLFQAPSLLTQNRLVTNRGRPVYKIAFRRKVSSERIILRFALQLGIIPIVGPSSLRHIRDDVDALSMIDLSRRDLNAIEQEAILTTQQKAKQYLASLGTSSDKKYDRSATDRNDEMQAEKEHDVRNRRKRRKRRKRKGEAGNARY